MRQSPAFLLLIAFSFAPRQAFGSDTGIPNGVAARSVSQYGITWTFDKDYPVGQFVTGDYWVKGPVKIVGISPKSVTEAGGRVVNGSMLNPAISLKQGYDSNLFGPRDSNYIASLNAGRPRGAEVSPMNPLAIDTGSLISGISIPIEGPLASRVRVMAVLTVVGDIPPPDAFRPPYVGSDKSIRHTLSEAETKLSSLPRLPSPPGAPSISVSLERFEKPWVEHMADWQKQLFCAPENMPNYGREIAMYVSEAACHLVLDANRADKKLLAARMIQLGLDNYGILTQPGGRITWAANGGHMSGRAFPVIFAGYMLGDSEIAGIMKKTGRYAYQDGHVEGKIPSDYVHFGEIDQTFYVSQRDVDRTHSPAWKPDNRAEAIPYDVSDIGMPEWGIGHVYLPVMDNKNILATYRQVNVPAWAGFVLVSRILGIADAWNHPALFDYMDRWMKENFAQNGFLNDMWAVYRRRY
jgi:hypothetical protein